MYFDWLMVGQHVQGIRIPKGGKQSGIGKMSCPFLLTHSPLSRGKSSCQSSPRGNTASVSEGVCAPRHRSKLQRAEPTGGASFLVVRNIVLLQPLSPQKSLWLLTAPPTSDDLAESQCSLYTERCVVLEDCSILQSIWFCA